MIVSKLSEAEEHPSLNLMAEITRSCRNKQAKKLDCEADIVKFQNTERENSTTF